MIASKAGGNKGRDDNMIININIGSYCNHSSHIALQKIADRIVLCHLHIIKRLSKYATPTILYE